MYALLAEKDSLYRFGKGTTHTTIYFPEVKAFHICLPSIGVQCYIIAKIEELFSDLDAGVAALKRAKANLKRYRAAVLKAAVEGKLTEQWRRKNPPTESASKLLVRILAERRRNWEEQQRAKYAEKGKEPPKGWQSRYREPVTPNRQSMPLPSSWQWATVDQASLSVNYGSSAKTSIDPSGIPVLRMGNIRDGGLDLADLKYLPEEHSEFPRLILKTNDLLFNRTNSAELVGKSAIYEGEPSPCSYASYLVGVRLLEGCDPRMVCHALNSAMGRKWIRSVASQQVGQANVNGTKLRSFAFPLPPEQEQRQIGAKVEELLSILEKTLGQVNGQLHRASGLRQAILRRAFEGRLVRQRPTADFMDGSFKHVSGDNIARQEASSYEAEQ